MKINPCIVCKEKIKTNYYPEFKKWLTFRSSDTYYAQCSACSNETDVQESLESAVQAWNKLNASPQEKAEKAKEAWGYVSGRIGEVKKSLPPFFNGPIITTQLEILDEFFNTMNAEGEEIEK